MPESAKTKKYLLSSVLFIPYHTKNAAKMAIRLSPLAYNDAEGHFERNT